MDKTIKTIIQHAISISSTTNILPKISILISVRHKDRQSAEHGENHSCTFSGLPDFGKGRILWHNKKVDVVVDTLVSSYVTEETYMDALVREMETRGYLVQHKKVGICTGACIYPKIEGQYCGAQLFCLQLKWQ